MKIEVKGPIISDSEQWIYDWYDMPATSAGKVNKLLSNVKENEEIEVEINSGGGSVFAGSEIYTALKSCRGKVTGKIVGIAGSAASVIAMGCNDLHISPTAQIMIHNSQGIFAGDYNDMQLGADILKGINESIANAYVLKTGMSTDEILNMMNKETWLNAHKAVEFGFCNKIMFADSQASITNEVKADANGVLPKEVIEKMRNQKDKIINSVKNVQEDIRNDDGVEIAKAKLRLQVAVG